MKLRKVMGICLLIVVVAFGGLFLLTTIPLGPNNIQPYGSPAIWLIFAGRL